MSEVSDERECYRYLLAGILRQAITDYVISRRILNRKRTRSVGYHEGIIRSCERFFKDPPYDYGDIDFKQLQRLCEEKVNEPGRIYIRENEVRES